MKIEMHVAENVETTENPMVITAFAIIPPNDKLEHGIGIPIIRQTGSYEELRAEMHRIVDDMFDAQLNINKFEKTT